MCIKNVIDSNYEVLQTVTVYVINKCFYYMLLLLL